MSDLESPFKFFPWERDENPFFVSETGYEWYTDKDTQKWVSRETHNLKPLRGVYVCFVRRGDDIERVLIDENQNILYCSKSLEEVCVHIDMLKLSKQL